MASDRFAKTRAEFNSLPFWGIPVIELGLCKAEELGGAQDRFIRQETGGRFLAFLGAPESALRL
jgi:hypothetical protein